MPVKSLDNHLKLFIGLMKTASLLYHSNPNNLPKKMDIADDDIKNLLRSLGKYQVKFLLIGGMASVVHGHIRTTQDMNLWIKKESQNQQNLINALKENQVAGADYLKNAPLIFGWTSVNVGFNGLEVDLGSELKSKLDFDECYAHSLKANFEGVKFRVLHLNDLIIEKMATARPKDLADIEELKKIQQRK